MAEEEKTIFDLLLHETLSFKNDLGGVVEVTRVPNGWIYAFDYPAFRQSPIVFVPFSTEGLTPKALIKLSKKK